VVSSAQTSPSSVRAGFSSASSSAFSSASSRGVIAAPCSLSEQVRNVTSSVTLRLSLRLLCPATPRRPSHQRRWPPPPSAPASPLAATRATSPPAASCRPASAGARAYVTTMRRMVPDEDGRWRWKIGRRREMGKATRLEPCCWTPERCTEHRTVPLAARSAARCARMDGKHRVPAIARWTYGTQMHLRMRTCGRDA